MVRGDRRLRDEWVVAMSDPEASLHVSSVIAFEYADLRQRKRIPVEEPLDELVERFELIIEGFPAGCWREAAELVPLHRDPVDRMLIAHALADGFTLVTADADIRRYPVPFIR
jgi:PIN domain nuclease of toxin-antitoxin system